MSYVARHLMPGETIERKTQVHWFIYLPALAVLVIVVAIVTLLRTRTDAGKSVPMEYVEVAGGVLCALFFLVAFVRREASEFAVTNKRVMIKVGLFWRHSTEILLRQVEGITVDQTLMGRLFDYGTITVEGTGSDRTPYRKIAGPLKFRLAVQEQIEKAISPPAAPSAPAEAAPGAGRRDPYDELLRLNELKEKGILTEEEFKAQKQKILS